MRVWDFPPHLLCMCHVSGQHKEIHDIWSILAKGEISPYYKHPEVQRWINNRWDLWDRHNDTVTCLKTHKTPLIEPPKSNAPLTMVNSLEEQLLNIKAKSEDPNHRCTCDIMKLAKYIWPMCCESIIVSKMENIAA